MPDEQNFPTAIVPTRPGGISERWDQLARRFGDPLAKLFLIQATTYDEDRAIRAAAELLPYRYPKLKVSETRLSAADGAGGVSVTINIGQPLDPAMRAIDVTPADLPDPLS